jgi:imidazolonepropionase
MPSLLIHNISKLLLMEDQKRPFKKGAELSYFPTLSKAWLLLENEIIKDFGSGAHPPADETWDAQGGLVMPSYVDSHSHLIYAGTREDEFAKRLRGKSYAQIAAEGGGILNSAQRLQNTTEDDLYLQAATRLKELMQLGTGALEIKSGYGLTTASEIKMLRVAKKLGENFPITLKTSFLGAHALPLNYATNRQGYLKEITEEMLPAIADEKLADYVDVFCEKDYFTVAEMQQVLVAAQKYKLRAKVHVNQFTSTGALQAALEFGALSVDHLEVMTSQDIADLGKSQTIGTLLPGCSFFLEIPYAPARNLIRANATVALATDFNPGSAPSGNMNLAVALACIKMKMTPEEALSAATLNGAAALEISNKLGSIEKGKLANLIVTKPMQAASFIPYNFGHNPVAHVFLNGKRLGND